MTVEEKKRVLQLIFSEIRADHTEDGLNIEFRPKPIWEPYVVAVLARQRQGQSTAVPVTTSERKTGFEPAVRTRSHAATPRWWSRPAAPRGLESCTERQRAAFH